MKYTTRRNLRRIGPLALGLTLLANASLITGALASTYYLDNDGADQTACGTSACGSTACRTYLFLRSELPGETLGEGDTVILCATESNTVNYGDGIDRGIDISTDDVTIRGESPCDPNLECTTKISGGRHVQPSNPNAVIRVRDAANVTVRDLEVTGTYVGAAGVLFNSSHDFNVVNVFTHDSQGPGMKCGAGGPGGREAALRGSIRNSRVKDDCQSLGGCAGILAFACPLLEIENVRVDGTGSPPSGDRDGIHITNSHGFVIRGGRMWGWSEDGIDLSRTGSGNDSCTSWNGGGCVGGSTEGLSCERDADCDGGGSCRRWLIESTVVYGNTLSGTGSALAIKSCAHHGTIRNNFLEDLSGTGDTLRFEACSHDVQVHNNSMYGHIKLWENTYALDIRNNIIVSDNPSVGALTICDHCVNLLPGDETTFDHNLVYSRSTSRAISGFPGAGATPVSEELDCNGYPCCKAQPGGDSQHYTNDQGTEFTSDNQLGGVGSNNIFGADIAFVDETAAPIDLHLPPGTNETVQGSGASLAGFTDDIDGDPRGSSWDIGADQAALWDPRLLSAEPVPEP